MVAKTKGHRSVTKRVKRPVGRKSNSAYRTREHLTESEVASCWMPFRATETVIGTDSSGCLSIATGFASARRATSVTTTSTCPDERLSFEGSRAARTVAERAGEGAKLPFPVHVHMLRHSSGYALAAKGMDARNTS
jgi:hypothetical protein